MSQKEVELPELPNGLWWETISMPIKGVLYLKFSIWKKRFGFFRQKMVESDIIKLESNSLEEVENIIKMNCDILVLQLPDRMHIEVEDE